MAGTGRTNLDACVEEVLALASLQIRQDAAREDMRRK